MTNYFKQGALLLLFGGMGFFSKAQSLGTSVGNYLEINSIQGSSTSNTIKNKRWLVRDADGDNWLTARLHDGIGIDGSYLVPMSNTRTWWERDPYNNIQVWGNGSQAYMALKEGRMGIGTLNPTSKLHVWDVEPGWMITSRVQAVATGDINGIKLMNGYASETNKWSGIASVAESNHSNKTGLSFYTATTEKVRISSDGNVGIGTTNPTAKLAVNGVIRSKEIKVETANWADYVFRKDYQLPALSEIEAYIQEHRHLPGIPSEEEVKRDGISLGEMNKKLLEKVEELTLHLIEKEKQLTEQEKRIEALEILNEKQ